MFVILIFSFCFYERDNVREVNSKLYVLLVLLLVKRSTCLHFSTKWKMEWHTHMQEQKTRWKTFLLRLARVKKYLRWWLSMIRWWFEETKKESDKKNVSIFILTLTLRVRESRSECDWSESKKKKTAFLFVIVCYMW